jgi:hypothetical protein
MVMHHASGPVYVCKQTYACAVARSVDCKMSAVDIFVMYLASACHTVCMLGGPCGVSGLQMPSVHCWVVYAGGMEAA